MTYGLIGEKLGHSFSPRIHARLSPYQYELMPLAPGELDGFMKARAFLGLNVTIPYKRDVMAYCDVVSEEAAAIGSVNTLVSGSDGRLFGYNTDIYGMCYMAGRRGFDFHGAKALILGSGGTALTAAAAAKRLGAAEIVTISRGGGDNYTNLHRHFDTGYIINTTPVGMYPYCGASPVELRLFPRLRGVMDVIYNPLRSELLLQAEALGIPYTGGLSMLVAQAKGSAELFLKQAIADSKIEEIYDGLMRELTNIVLVGMPGSGKTSVGKAVAGRLGRDFFDIDEEITRRAGMSIPDIFSKSGEAAFRELESSVISEFGKRNGGVIATGGGAVLREANYAPLRQNGCIIWLQRDSTVLPTAGRPLSQGIDLGMMYAQRHLRYRRFANAAVENNCHFDDTVAKVLEAYNTDPP